MTQNKKSFTLVELIMAIIILAFIAGVTTPFMANAVNYWALVRAERDIMFSARLALNRVVREIREIKNVASITANTNTNFAFTRIKADGTDETVNYQQSGKSLLRNSLELADNLKSSGGLTFTYLDADGNSPGTLPEDIRLVRIDLILESGDAKVAIQSLARFRNIT